VHLMIGSLSVCREPIGRAMDANMQPVGNLRFMPHNWHAARVRPSNRCLVLSWPIVRRWRFAAQVLDVELRADLHRLSRPTTVRVLRGNVCQMRKCAVTRARKCVCSVGNDRA
jgi:hypothetical protein